MTDGLDPTVVSPAAKSLPGRFSSGSRQGTGRTFDEWRVLPKVTAPRYGVLRVRPTESSPVQRAKCQKCCLKGVFSLPQAMLWGRFPIWRLVTRLLGLGRLAGRCDIRLGLSRSRPTFQRTGRAREAEAMTWDLALTWFIMPAVVALILGGGGLWLSRRLP